MTKANNNKKKLQQGKTAESSAMSRSQKKQRQRVNENEEKTEELEILQYTEKMQEGCNPLAYL